MKTCNWCKKQYEKGVGRYCSSKCYWAFKYDEDPGFVEMNRQKARSRYTLEKIEREKIKKMRTVDVLRMVGYYDE